VVLRYRHRDGKHIPFEITHRNRLNDPARGRVLTEMVDVSERMEAVEALRASEQLLRRLTETLPLGILQIDADQRSVYRNERLLEILGVANAATLDAQFALVARADRELLGAALDELMTGGEPADVEFTIDDRRGPRRCSVTMRALSSADGAINGALVCVADVTERARLRDELGRRAKFDDLTHCHTRAAILEVLDRALRQPHDGVAVLFIDLDDFKQINDRYGHAAGDDLLQLTGQRLLASVRAEDIVGRLCGDEFLVVCPDVATSATALDIAHRIAAALTQDAMLGAAAIVPTASIGVAWTDRAVGCDELVATADEAMYESKRAAGGPVLALR